MGHMVVTLAIKHMTDKEKEPKTKPVPHVEAEIPLTEEDEEVLDEVWAEHGGKDQWQLVDWCHTHCKEWTPVANGCAPIAVEQVGMALGKSAAQVNRLRQEATELNQLDEIFAVA